MKEEEEEKEAGSIGDDDPNLISQQWKDGVLFEVGTDYEIVELIGEGWYWSKYSAKKTSSNDEVVITKFPDPFLYDRFKIVMGNYSRFIPIGILREIVVCKFLRFHPLFLEMIDVILPPGRETQFNPWSVDEFNDVYLVYASTESNLDQLIKSKKRLRFEFESIFAQLIIGLHYLKRLKLIHRNLDPHELLVNKESYLKISDFHNSTQPEKMMNLTVCTNMYSAPELILGCKSYDYSVDIWSAGCILGAILKGKDLFLAQSSKEHLRDIILLVGVPSEDDLHFIDNEEGRILVNTIIDDIKVEELRAEAASESQISSLSTDDDVSKPAIDLLKLMLSFNPNKRIKVEDALQHDYIAENVQFWKETYEGRIQYPITDDMWDDMDEKEKLSELTSDKHLWVNPTKELRGNMFDDIVDNRKLRHLILTEMQRFHLIMHE